VTGRKQQEKYRHKKEIVERGVERMTKWKSEREREREK
jgi:hypothetical protein